MWSRVKREDLAKAVSRFLDEHGYGSMLWVCEKYVLTGNEIISNYSPPPWADPDGDLDAYSVDRWRSYSPLEETPDLFLKLARLHEEEDFTSAALEFVHHHGVPGQMDSYAWFAGTAPREHSVARIRLDVFREEARRAWYALRMYEAVLNRDAKRVREIADRGSDWFADMLGDMVAAAQAIKRNSQSDVLNDSEMEDGEDVEDWLDLEGALHSATFLVLAYVEALCSPSITYPVSQWGEAPDPMRVTRAWTFENLLGAAYLQMYWLITSGGDLARCRYCGRIISLARPNATGRKPRTDKRYCNPVCKQSHWRERNRTS